MSLAGTHLHQLDCPAPDSLPVDPLAWLEELPGATLIRQQGLQSGPPRVVCTLLHGNELSGVKAVHRWLSSAMKPHFDTLFLVVGVKVCLTEPRYTLRQLPDERDMNRCFLPPFEDRPGRLAEQILALLRSQCPESMLDIHNTSGHSPAFGVATHEDPAHEALLSLFAQHLVVTDLRLGAIMEHSDRHCPIVTIECGGLTDPKADDIAWKGLQRYLQQEDVLTPQEGLQIDLYHHPVRLELTPSCVLAVANQPVLGADLTIPKDLDRYNFGEVEQGLPIGWVASERSLERLKLHNKSGEDLMGQYFRCCGNHLVTAQRLKLFMVTTSPTIAASDCLLYASLEREHTRLNT
ncbi:M14 family metallopeptidase [Marinobacterium jannaschii]|uniref:succinylglutamate desuccinylase/aspartoacylase domain-containing protein n=1 Tax=Marinobacterium jannaschii TaxID=64970 RepID=UPI00055A9FB0|nr:succinylglutamate desuccinylase/aspartoacylase family protein [Marinobacterium jannaschii]